jgi:hypothetical protein
MNAIFISGKLEAESTEIIHALWETLQRAFQATAMSQNLCIVV